MGLDGGGGEVAIAGRVGWPGEVLQAGEQLSLYGGPGQ